jgi:VIT1/CCC1 family predicted Fe2+/Mn2+ transporter
MAISLDPTTRDAVTAAFRQALAGKLHDPQAALKFLQTDLQTQEQVIKTLASGATPEELAQVEAALVASTRAAAAKSAQPHITAEAHWWGYQIFIPEKVMQQLKEAPSLLATITALLTPVLVGPLLPVLGIIVGYVAAEFAAMKAVDKGRGVELSATWVAPVVLVPSAL